LEDEKLTNSKHQDYSTSLYTNYKTYRIILNDISVYKRVRRQR